jgi:hypothetical protein
MKSATQVSIQNINQTLTRIENIQESIFAMLNVNRLTTLDHERAIATLNKPIARGKGMNAVHVLKEN